jgi:uncharacterized protein (TIGR03067 family)
MAHRWHHVENSKISYSGTTMVLDIPHLSNEQMTGTLHKADPSKTPHEMEWVRATEPSAGTTLLAIYEISGDTFRVCFDPSGNARPEEFAGSGHVCHVWKRVKS